MIHALHELHPCEVDTLCRVSTQRVRNRLVASNFSGHPGLLILRTLRPGPSHGYAIAKHIQRTSEDLLKVERPARSIPPCIGSKPTAGSRRHGRSPRIVSVRHRTARSHRAGLRVEHSHGRRAGGWLRAGSQGLSYQSHRCTPSRLIAVHRHRGVCRVVSSVRQRRNVGREDTWRVHATAEG